MLSSSSTAPERGGPVATLPGRVAVIGAGVMGAGIAQSLAVAGSQVALTDVKSEVVERALREIRGGRFGLDSAVHRGKLDDAAAREAFARITARSSVDELGDVDVVVEAVPEDLALKIAIFRRLDAVTPERTILASNSSGLPISALAAATDRPDRVIGWHWASPAPVMRLAEIVRTPHTSPQTVTTIEALARAAGKNPVVVNDTSTSWGYVANRIYAAAFREAHRVVDEGIASPDQVDQLLIDCFRWPTGPFGMSAGARTGWKKRDDG